MENIKTTMQESLTSRELDCNLKIKDEIEKCSVCGQFLQKIIYIPGLNRSIKAPIMCKCKKDKIKAREERERAMEKQIRLKHIFKNSLMDNKFIEDKFGNWDSTIGSKKMYHVAKMYSNNFNEMKQRGMGLMFYGKPGNGKTFTASCIANFLMNKMLSVVCVNINSLLSRIRQTYNTYGREVEEDVLRGFDNADLLIIDDLGTEQSTDWAKSKIYSIIDKRYRSKLPLIITTNFTLEELEDKYEKRTVDRIIEICTPVYNEAGSIRVRRARENTERIRGQLAMNN